MTPSLLIKIISGGQTGVDRAALDAAMAAGLAHGGWCPAGRQAEDGAIPTRYALRETPSADAAERTGWNVRDSDGTLVLLVGRAEGGTALTIAEAERLGRPWLAFDLGGAGDPALVRLWLESNGIATLNVAGPRESDVPGIHARAGAFLRALLGGGMEADRGRG